MPFIQSRVKVNEMKQKEKKLCHEDVISMIDKYLLVKTAEEWDQGHEEDDHDDLVEEKKKLTWTIIFLN